MNQQDFSQNGYSTATDDYFSSSPTGQSQHALGVVGLYGCLASLEGSFARQLQQSNAQTFLAACRKLKQAVDLNSKGLLDIESSIAVSMSLQNVVTLLSNIAVTQGLFSQSSDIISSNEVFFTLRQLVSEQRARAFEMILDDRDIDRLTELRTSLTALEGRIVSMHFQWQRLPQFNWQSQPGMQQGDVFDSFSGASTLESNDPIIPPSIVEEAATNSYYEGFTWTPEDTVDPVYAAHFFANMTVPEGLFPSSSASAAASSSMDGRDPSDTAPTQPASHVESDSDAAETLVGGSSSTNSSDVSKPATPLAEETHPSGASSSHTSTDVKPMETDSPERTPRQLLTPASSVTSRTAGNAFASPPTSPTRIPLSPHRNISKKTSQTSALLKSSSGSPTAFNRLRGTQSMSAVDFRESSRAAKAAKARKSLGIVQENDDD